MLEEDIEPLAAALQDEVGAPQLWQRWEGHRDGSRAMWVAEVDGRVVGTISAGGLEKSTPIPRLEITSLTTG